MTDREILKELVSILYENERHEIYMQNVSNFGMNEENWQVSSKHYEKLKKLKSEIEKTPINQ